MDEGMEDLPDEESPKDEMKENRRDFSLEEGGEGERRR